MKQYKLSEDYVLRADPHLEKYTLFNYKTGKIVHLTEYDNLLLNILSNGPVNISDLAKFICKEYSEFSATPEYLCEITAIPARHPENSFLSYAEKI